jgi:hypothetical protein
MRPRLAFAGTGAGAASMRKNETLGASLAVATGDATEPARREALAVSRHAEDKRGWRGYRSDVGKTRTLLAHTSHARC